MKIAILHEMLIKKWGAEKVVQELLNIFPHAQLYTLMYDEKTVWNDFAKKDIHKSCFSLPSQKLYNLTKRQRFSLPLMKRSVEMLDFSNYDYVIVSSSGFAHWLKTGENTKTILYYHAPARYMWDWTHEYRRDIWMDKWIRGYLYGKFMKNLRVWDYEASQKNDVILANSKTTRKRIAKYYRRESEVVFPPIETERFAKNLSSREDRERILWNSPYKKSSWEYYIILSALTEFKRIDIAIKAFKNMPKNNLLIIWDGEYRWILENLAWKAENIDFTWAQYGDDLVYLVQNSLGLVFPGEEDFGIVPIEVMAAWKPVFALSRWGLTETVITWKTGEFFDDPNGKDFVEKFKLFHKNNTEWVYTESNCKKQAALYDKKVFRKKIQKYIK